MRPNAIRRSQAFQKQRIHIKLQPDSCRQKKQCNTDKAVLLYWPLGSASKQKQKQTGQVGKILRKTCHQKQNATHDPAAPDKKAQIASYIKTCQNPQKQTSCFPEAAPGYCKNSRHLQKAGHKQKKSEAKRS